MAHKVIVTACVAVVAAFLVSCHTKKNIVKSNIRDIRNAVDNEEMFTKNTLIVSYDADIGKEELLAAVKRMKCEVIYEYSIINAIAIRIPDGANINKYIDKLSKVKGVIGVERDRIYKLQNDNINTNSI